MISILFGMCLNDFKGCSKESCFCRWPCTEADGPRGTQEKRVFWTIWENTQSCDKPEHLVCRLTGIQSLVHHLLFLLLIIIINIINPCTARCFFVMSSSKGVVVITQPLKSECCYAPLDYIVCHTASGGATHTTQGRA